MKNTKKMVLMIFFLGLMLHPDRAFSEFGREGAL